MSDPNALDATLSPLRPPLPLPNGMREADVIELFSSFELEGAPKAEIEGYWRQDWKRFVYTFGLAADLKGDCLELGANPYFTSILLRLFSSLNLTFANYFGPGLGSHGAQTVTVRPPSTDAHQSHTLEFQHFNIE